MSKCVKWCVDIRFFLMTRCSFRQHGRFHQVLGNYLISENEKGHHHAASGRENSRANTGSDLFASSCQSSAAAQWMQQKISYKFGVREMIQATMIRFSRYF